MVLCSQSSVHAMPVNPLLSAQPPGSVLRQTFSAGSSRCTRLRSGTKGCRYCTGFRRRAINFASARFENQGWPPARSFLTLLAQLSAPLLIPFSQSPGFLKSAAVSSDFRELDERR